MPLNLLFPAFYDAIITGYLSLAWIELLNLAAVSSSCKTVMFGRRDRSVEIARLERNGTSFCSARPGICSQQTPRLNRLSSPCFFTATSRATESAPALF